MNVLIKAKIESLTYRPCETIKSLFLNEYSLETFNINDAASSGFVSVDSRNKIAYSKWVTPKRTRSYPFDRIYDTYSYGGKRVTVIPVIKDEGLGERKNDSNNDRINFITLSWMNLTNVYVILAWYSGAEKKSPYRITNQEFDANYVNIKLKEISEYQFDAHHWNRHFEEDFVRIYQNAVSSYEAISKSLKVRMHKFETHQKFLKKILLEDGNKINLEKFAEVSLFKSKLAAAREVATKHKYESLSKSSVKGIFEMQNNLGGKYFLTCDELDIDSANNKVLIQECKNSKDGKLPQESDIKDGLFKVLLFSQIKELQIGEVAYDYCVNLRLTGKFNTTLTLPNSESSIENFCLIEKLSATNKKLIKLINDEAELNNYTITLESNA